MCVCECVCVFGEGVSREIPSISVPGGRIKRFKVVKIHYANASVNVSIRTILRSPVVMVLHLDNRNTMASELNC